MRSIFIDESRIEKGSRFLLFGSLWLHNNKLPDFENRFWELWDASFPTRKSELKWTKVSKGRIHIYKEFVNLFWDFPNTDFRCMVIDKHSIDYQKYHDGNEELGFYKFLYFFLSRNIEKDYKHREITTSYQLFLDHRRQNDSIEVGSLQKLKEVMNNRLDNHCSEIQLPVVRSVESVRDSKQSPAIQIVDVLMGAVGYAFEGYQTSRHKLELIEHIESRFQLRLSASTPYLSEKVNIWKFEFKTKKE